MYQQNQILDVNFEDPKKFTQKVQTLQEQMPHILDDFKKYFILYNKDPNYPEYQNMFENVKTNLNTLSSTLFITSNDVDSNTDKVNSIFLKLNGLIMKEKKMNRELKRKLGIIEENGNSSEELIVDYSEMYNMGYLRNWGLFLSILVVGLCISKVYKPPSMNNISYN